MSDVSIAVIEPVWDVDHLDPRIKAARKLISEEDLPAYVGVFACEAFERIELVAVAADKDRSPLGLATMGTGKEWGTGDQPYIIDCWVAPKVPIWQDLDVALLRALSDEAQRRCGQIPVFHGCSAEDVDLCRRVIAAGVQVDFRDLHTK